MPRKPAVDSESLVKWDAEFAKFASQAVEQEKGVGGGAIIKFGRGIITCDGAELTENNIELIILGSVHLNQWFEEEYDSDHPTPPDCYALGTSDKEMAPHEEAPNKQSDNCVICGYNEMGTGKRGRGKACQNRRRFAALLASDCTSAEDAAKATIYTSSVSPTNLKAWAGYIHDLADRHKRPSWAVVTQVSCFDDKKTQIKLEFKISDAIKNNALLTVLRKRLDGIESMLTQPFPPPPEKGKKKPADKTAAKQKFAGAGRRK